MTSNAVVRPVHLIHSVITDGDIPISHTDFYNQMYLHLGFDRTKQMSKWSMFGIKLSVFRRLVQAKEGGIEAIAESPFQMTKKDKVTGEIVYKMTARKLYRRSDLMRIFRAEVLKALV